MNWKKNSTSEISTLTPDFYCEIVRLTSVDGGDGVRLTLTGFADGEEKRTLTLSADDFLSLGVMRGGLDEEAFQTLSDAAGRYTALRAAYRLLSAGQCSRKKLYEKLRARRIPDADARFAVETAYARGYIDEDWQIASYIRTLAEKNLYGPRKIHASLAAKGYSGDAVRKALAETLDEEKVLRLKRAFLEKKFGKTKPETPKEAQTMCAALYKQGF